MLEGEVKSKNVVNIEKSPAANFHSGNRTLTNGKFLSKMHFPSSLNSEAITIINCVCP